MKMSFKKFIPAILWFIITLVLLTLPGSSFPKANWLGNLQIDKLVHIGLFSVLVYLFFMPFLQSGLTFETKKSRLIWIAVLGLTYGIVMEFVQKYWVPNRSFDIFDIAADGAGSFLPLFLLKQLNKWKGPKV